MNLLKIIFLVLVISFFSSFAFAESQPTAHALRVGEKFESLILQDQHGGKVSVPDRAKFVLISSSMKLSKEIHEWLSKKDSNYLASKDAQYIADITPMPDIITYLFAGPKMRRYKFEIILADDPSFAPKFPQSEDRLAVFTLDKDGVVIDTSFYKSIEEAAAEKFGEAVAGQ
jgi:hypothetical protein